MTKRAMILALLAACVALRGGHGQDRAPSRGGERDDRTANPVANAPLLDMASELARADPVDPVSKQGFHKVYPVKLAAGVSYRIDLVSTDFDPFLRLEDSDGKPLAQDGGVEGHTARIVLKVVQTDQYRMIVTTNQAGKTGAFLLAVRRSDQAPVHLVLLRVAALKLGIASARLFQQQKLPEATAKLQKAVDLFRNVYPKEEYPDGHPELAVCLDGMGRLLRAQGAYEAAEPFCRQALAMRQALYPKARFPQGHAAVAGSLVNLGSLLQAQGKYGEAEPFHRRALAMTQALYPTDRYPEGHPDLAAGLNNLGFLLWVQGEYGKAEPLFRQALAMGRTLYPPSKYPHGHPDLASSLHSLGALFHKQEKYDQAEQFYREALVMRQALFPKDRFPEGHPELARNLSNLGTLLSDQGAYDAAEPLHRQALAMQRTLNPKDRYPQGHPDLATGLNNLGVLLLHQGEYRQAEPLLREALAMHQALYPAVAYPDGHADLVASLDNLGVALELQGHYAKAEPLRRQALAMHTQLAARLAKVAPEPVALNAAAAFPLIRDGLLSVTAHVPGSDERVYEAVWHSRAAVTRVYQRRHLALIAAATDDAVRSAWNGLQLLRRQHEQLIMAPAIQDATGRAAKLRTLAEQIDTAEHALLPQLPILKYYEDLARQGPDALRKRLPANAVFVDFLRYTCFAQDAKQRGKRGEKRTVRYLAFVVSRGAARRVELGDAAAVDTAVRDWRAAIVAVLPSAQDGPRQAHEAKLAAQAAALRRLLWEPIQQHLPAGTATVYLAPDAELTQLPWAALPGTDRDRILLDDYALAILPHGPFLLEQLTPPPPRSAKRAPAAAGLLLVGGIQYDDRPSGLGTAPRGAEEAVTQKVVWRPLAGTQAERRLIAQCLATAKVRLSADLGGRDPTTVRLRQELERCRYAHIGTHGFFADVQFRSILQLDPKLFERTTFQGGHIGERIGAAARNPLVLSGLVCAGANLPDTPERGILSADAIAGLLLDDLHLAVLSACDTGIGDVAGGEGVFGLQRAFHIAGCKNVVASLWKVDDAATAALMTRFYSHLFAGQKAPIEALRQAQLDLYRHPELIPAWAKGETRAPGKARPATTPAPPDTPRELLTSAGRTPIRLWAAFTLSGAGRE